MAELKKVNKEQIFSAIEGGEFGPDITESKSRVAVVMTQDWCPFWAKMQQWVNTMDNNPQLDIYEIIYNKQDYFDIFLDFKENVFKNRTIPYIRFYINGKFIKDANVISQKEFLKALDL